MPRQLTVWGGTTFPPFRVEIPNVDASHRQVRAIVAVPSFAACQRAAFAAGLFKPGRDAWCSSGNAEELKVALAQPGVVFVRALDDHRGSWVALRGDGDGADASA